jgi:hypothetical protein
MNGNFDPTQNLRNSDQTVDARGWLSWDATDASAEITISVVQNGYTCPAAQPITCTPRDSTWRVDVTRPAPPWQRGGAAGTAAATVTRRDGSTYDVPWDSPPLTLH